MDDAICEKQRRWWNEIRVRDIGGMLWLGTTGKIGETFGKLNNILSSNERMD
jgi:hypothetical protein